MMCQSQPSQYLSITPEELETYSSLAERVRAQPPMPERWLHADHAIWKVGTATFKRPLGETLIDFITTHLKFTFGKAWSDKQHKLPAEERHAVMRWWFSLCELQESSAGAAYKQGTIYKIEPSGDAMELMTLAHDLYHLRLADILRPRLVNRLRNHAEFQGARYECAIAASFLRSGFSVSWQTGTSTKCEFVATHRISAESIAIEVKSRRRSGTLNEPGAMPDPSSLRVDVKQLYERALDQCPTDTPCGIFIDVNLPREPDTSTPQIPWQQDIKEILSRFPRPTAQHPALETCLVFTNFGWHYAGRKKAKGHREVFTFPQYVRNRIRNPATFIAILRTIQDYGDIPSFV